MKSLNRLIVTAGFALMFLTVATGAARQDNKGNPIPHFLYPKFQEGIVVMKDGQKFNTLINYNMVDEKMITEVEGVYRYSKNPASIERVIIGDRTFIPVGIAFYEILTSGNVTLFVQHKSILAPKGNETGYGSKNRSVGPTSSQRFELTPVTQQYGEVVNIDLPLNVEITPASVYWVSMGTKLEKFSTERQFVKLFPEYEKQLKDFLSNENISIRKRDDLVKLGNYCNEIMK
jgi:hypothetical protein